VVDAEGSWHGKYLRLVDPFTDRARLRDHTRVCAFVQPGKHAFAATPELFRLFPGMTDCCMEEAGKDGIAPSEMVSSYFDITEEMQRKTREYIRAQYGFRPSLEFTEREWKEELLMPWEELLQSIPERMNRQIEMIDRWEGKKQ
jgi:hypothetical protein